MDLSGIVCSQTENDSWLVKCRHSHCYPPVIRCAPLPTSSGTRPLCMTHFSCQIRVRREPTSLEVMLDNCGRAYSGFYDSPPARDCSPGMITARMAERLAGRAPLLPRRRTIRI